MPTTRTTRKFHPAIDGLEPRLVLSARPAHALVSIKADLNSRVLSFAKAKLGTKVGDGECATLAAEAVKAAGGKRFDQLGPTGTNADYVWGRKVTTLKTSGGSISAVKPGDIIQFRSVSFRQDTKVMYSNGASRTSYKTSSYSHHTAVVESVSGKFINLLQQNVGSAGKSADAKKIVQRGTIWGSSFSTLTVAKDGTKTTKTYKFLGGTMWVYRPYS
jgi:hypothetical protein